MNENSRPDRPRSTARRFDGSVKLLLLITALVVTFMWSFHDFIPMWIEGMPFYVEHLLAATGARPATHLCTGYSIAGLTVPLGQYSHEGAASIYLDLPAAYMYVNHWLSDPYAYRYSTAIVFVATAWLFFNVLCRVYPRPQAALGVGIFLLVPTQVLFNLTDHRWMITMSLLMLGTILFGMKYAEQFRSRHLWVCCFLAGVSLNGRTEAFVWPTICIGLYLAFFKRRSIAEWWRSQAMPILTIGAGLVSLGLGALPFIIYNITCPSQSVLSFLFDKSAPQALEGTGLVGRLLLRTQQFLEFVLLGAVPMYDLNVRNIPFALVFGLSFCVVLWSWLKRREPSFPLFSVVLGVPLTLFAGNSLRHEHFHLFHLPAIAVMVSGVARLDRPSTRGRRLARGLLVAVLLSSAATSLWDWIVWRQSPHDRPTMLNQSDPLMLAGALKGENDARIYFTNIGMRQYVLWTSRGEIDGKNLVSWDLDWFRQEFQRVLLDDTQTRLFVAVAPERDGSPGTLRRTQTMYAVLEASKTDHRVRELPSRTGVPLYHLIRVERGTAPRLAEISPSIEVAKVAARYHRDGKNVIGSVTGSGLRKYDIVRVNDGETFPTTFGNEGWVTYVFPRDVLGGAEAFRLVVIRPDTGEQSLPFTVVVWNPEK